MFVMIDNYDSFTYNIYQYLCELTDKPVKVFRNDEIRIAEIEALNPEGLIISPGPGNPDDAGISLAAVNYFKGKIPILGVCLGHQTIAQAFGADIVQAARIVHGKTESMRHDGKGLFRNVPNPAVFTRYHSLAAKRGNLPDCLEITATAPDGEIMGIRHKEYDVEGVQFHPESIASEGGKRLLLNFLNYRREPFAYKAVLRKAVSGTDLLRDEAAGFMRELTEGNLTTAQIAGILVALNSKGICADEIAGCAGILQEKRVAIESGHPLLDTCGTGGDGLGTFNISSMAALIASACGARVAKHGNRAVSSKSGSADFYRELGIKIDISPEKARTILEEQQFMFLFAPLYHGAMRHAAQPRRELGIKTIMNMLGPLVNPAAAEYQLIGVFDKELCMIEAKAAKLLGIKRIMCVHGSDGLDEITVTGPSHIVFIDENNEVQEYGFDPSEVGIPRYRLDDLKGGTGTENAEVARALLSGGGNPAVRDAVYLNAGAAMYVYGLCDDIASGCEKAKAAMDSGAVRAKLEAVIAASNRE